MPGTLIIDTGGTFSMCPRKTRMDHNESRGNDPHKDDVGNDLNMEALVVAPIEIMQVNLKQVIDRTGFNFCANATTQHEDVKYHPLGEDDRIDSAAATPTSWRVMATVIRDSASLYDGFVIVHGTDTLAYTSAAMSFMLCNFNKPVIITGAQVPLGAGHTDATNNIIGAVEFAAWKSAESTRLAGTFTFFGSKLIRGSTVIKIDSQRFNAFDSPRVPLVGEMKDGQATVNELISFDTYNCKGTQLRKPFVWQDVPDQKDGDLGGWPLLVQLYPGIKLANFQIEKYRAVVIVAHGCGNGPDLFEGVLKPYLAIGGLVAVVTECLAGGTGRQYAACVAGEDLRIAPCANMTTPSALVKATVLMGHPDLRQIPNDADPEYEDKMQFRHRRFGELMITPLAGEILYDSLAQYIKATVGPDFAAVAEGLNYICLELGLDESFDVAACSDSTTVHEFFHYASDTLGIDIDMVERFPSYDTQTYVDAIDDLKDCLVDAYAPARRRFDQGDALESAVSHAAQKLKIGFDSRGIAAAVYAIISRAQPSPVDMEAD